MENPKYQDRPESDQRPHVFSEFDCTHSLQVYQAVELRDRFGITEPKQMAKVMQISLVEAYKLIVVLLENEEENQR